MFSATAYLDDCILADDVEGEIFKHPGSLPSYGGHIFLSEEDALRVMPGTFFILDTHQGPIIHALVEGAGFGSSSGTVRVEFLSHGNPLTVDDLPK
jgi:hypothetical protein